ncbi:MAG: hypothetical protein NC206_00285 [Bacteroides sp.]|nr:hypothetical protein [Roseburia sp.]MCM1345513.1 hypothetical protein [Bacteroides sp.]MCM1420022.1 hypothetical protein [Bacteroides sp.]
MKKHYIKACVLCAAMLASLHVAAVERPKLQTQVLTNGEKYVLFNYARPDGYMSRTSWDGAYYFLGPDDSNYSAHEFTAIQNQDGTWSFAIIEEVEEEGEEPAITYIAVPNGTDNLNANTSDVALWTVEKGDYDGYYKLKAGEGNNYNCVDLYLHLNAGGQYFVISEPVNGGGWYPDYYGGAMLDEEGSEIYDETETYILMADKTSLNWGFVKADDVADYIIYGAAYASIQNVENNYMPIEGYENGFKIAVDNAAAIYASENLDEEGLASINDLLNSKISFYNEIEKAKSVNTTDNEALTTAVSVALNVFNASVDLDELTAALENLIEAEKTYLVGTGDFTSFGKNMSFEDLTAQNGSMTSEVANAPAGWNLYIKGNLSVTADDIKANGINSWCGVNDDCAGEVKDGNYGFGIWNSSIPEVELSQTITGLENGTYVVSAGMMVGANGGGSRRTTQRIFGNLNSTYFAAEGDYNLDRIDNSEVYGFANLVESVTDRDMQPLSVRAYVYDGTLTFGFRTNGDIAAALRTVSNSAGGDGWFKVDNFRIKNEGYIGEDAAAVANHYYGLCKEYDEYNYQMQTSVKNALHDKLSVYGAVDANTPVDEINATIFALKDELAIVTSSVKAYQKLSDALDLHSANLSEYDNYAGAGEYGDVIMFVETDWEDGVYDEAGVEDAIARLEKAFEECKLSGVAVGIYVTDLISNPSFEDLSAQGGSPTSGVGNTPKGWTLYVDGEESTDNGRFGWGWCGINSGDVINVELEDGTIVERQPTEGDNLWGIWGSNMHEVELSQTLAGIPAGTYILSADVMVQNNWAGDNITTQRIFANDYIQMFSYEELYELNLPEDAKNAAYMDEVNPDADLKHLTYAGYTCASGDRTTDLLHPMTVKFGVGEDGIAKIGFRTNNINPDGLTFEQGGRDGQGWFKVDNFTLFYESEEIPTAIGSVESSSVTTIVARQYFTVDGVRIAQPQNGINIVKNIMSDGTVKVSKVFVK